MDYKANLALVSKKIIVGDGILITTHLANEFIIYSGVHVRWDKAI